MDKGFIPFEWLPQYTYSDYETWEGDWELIYGIPYAMSPSPNRKHQSAGRSFMRLVEDALQHNREMCNCNVYYELDWIVNETTVVRPDVMIVCGAFEEDFLRFPPALILEIASKKTRLTDRNVKFKLYQSNGVKFYLLADPDRNTVEAFVLKDNYYQDIHSNSFELTPDCIISIDLTHLWE